MQVLLTHVVPEEALGTADLVEGMVLPTLNSNQTLMVRPCIQLVPLSYGSIFSKRTVLLNATALHTSVAGCLVAMQW